MFKINHFVWCSKSARLLVRDRLGSNCVRKSSALILHGSKVARNFSARNVILIENDRIEMLEHLKFLLVHIPNINVTTKMHSSNTLTRILHFMFHTGLMFLLIIILLLHFIHYEYISEVLKKGNSSSPLMQKRDCQFRQKKYLIVINFYACHFFHFNLLSLILIPIF